MNRNTDDQVGRAKRAKELQLARLAEVRAQVAAGREKALAGEPWSDMVTGIPIVNGDGKLTGMLPMATTDGVGLFGLRLAFELAGCCDDEAQVHDKINEYLSLVEDFDQFLLVAFAALVTLANYVVPGLLGAVETQASNYDLGVALAEFACYAWATRVGDLDQEVSLS
jgi:hypothetical protein